MAFSQSPEALLALGGVALLVAGGTTWSKDGQWPVFRRVLVFLTVIALARWVAGPAAAALTALLLALGAVLRVRLAEGITGLAAFGGAVALLGRASLRLVLVFWLVGLAIIAVQTLARRLRRNPSRPAFSEMRKGTPHSHF